MRSIVLALAEESLEQRAIKASFIHSTTFRWLGAYSVRETFYSHKTLESRMIGRILWALLHVSFEGKGHDALQFCRLTDAVSVILRCRLPQVW